MNEIKIGYEQEVAKQVLRKLYTVDPVAIVAGGAPRDWYLGNPCQDIDFYLRGNNFSTPAEFLRALENLDLLGFKLLSPKDLMYSRSSYLRWVFEGSFQTKKINVMVMEGDTDYENNFSTSICKIRYDQFGISPSQEFLNTLDTKVITIAQGYTGNEPHVIKMKERFNEYKFIKQEECSLTFCGF